MTSTTFPVLAQRYKTLLALIYVFQTQLAKQRFVKLLVLGTIGIAISITINITFTSSIGITFDSTIGSGCTIAISDDFTGWQFA